MINAKSSFLQNVSLMVFLIRRKRFIKSETGAFAVVGNGLTYIFLPLSSWIIPAWHDKEKSFTFQCPHTVGMSNKRITLRGIRCSRLLFIWGMKRNETSNPARRRS